MHRIIKTTPMRRAGRPADVSTLVAYLINDQIYYSTGQVGGVTGGMDIFIF